MYPSKTQQVITLWILITLGMLMHQFMSLHNLRFGANVIKAGYEGTPDIEQIKRLTLYVLPLLYVAITLYFQNRTIRLLHLIASPFYLGFHTWHFVHELGHMTDPVQWVLLTALVILSAMLVFSAFGWYKSPEKKPTQNESA